MTDRPAPLAPSAVPVAASFADALSAMNEAIAEGERARGTTGDNPWVGCVIVAADGELLARGHTQGPGEDHAEIAAFRQARRLGRSVVGATLYSTLEPCSFHGRTPACSRVIVDERIARVVLAMRDPHPRVDGQGARILRDAGLDVLEGVAEDAVRRQLGTWVLRDHPHEPRARAATWLLTLSREQTLQRLVETYDVPEAQALALLASLASG